MYFHFVFSDFLVEEQGPDKGKELQFWVNRNELRLYNLKECHPMDIIHDGKLYRNNVLIEMNVDFEELRRIQKESLDVFVEPLKNR